MDEVFANSDRAVDSGAPAALVGAVLDEEARRHAAQRARSDGPRDGITEGGAPPLLQIRDLDFSYGRVQVLFGVDLDVWEGEVLALLGTNGAGKSTLLRAITGLSRADRGTISVGGRCSPSGCARSWRWSAWRVAATSWGPPAAHRDVWHGRRWSITRLR